MLAAGGAIEAIYREAKEQTDELDRPHRAGFVRNLGKSARGAHAAVRTEGNGGPTRSGVDVRGRARRSRTAAARQASGARRVGFEIANAGASPPFAPGATEERS